MFILLASLTGAYLAIGGHTWKRYSKLLWNRAQKDRELYKYARDYDKMFGPESDAWESARRQHEMLPLGRKVRSHTDTSNARDVAHGFVLGLLWPGVETVRKLEEKK